MKRIALIVGCLALFVFPVQAKVDLVTLPSRDEVEITIYNSADLTLVREQRALTLKEGLNQLQFSWANTLIDPTSLEMIPKGSSAKIDIDDLTYPPRVKDLGLWNITSDMSGQVPVEISYLTSGLSWRAFYLGTLVPDESKMKLEGYVVVTNHSGEEYENAKVRMIVGQVHLIDEIVALAQREQPYGRPGVGIAVGGGMNKEEKSLRRRLKNGLEELEHEPYYLPSNMLQAPKEITKEGISEYFLYTIEGTETIPEGWSKRLPSFDVDEVEVVNLYKYEEERYGNSVVRFLSFKNDKEHNLGETPIPGGVIKVFRTVDPANHLSYEGQSNFKYIPVNEDVELNLGTVSTVIVKPTMMSYKTKDYEFNKHGNISGWDEVREYKVEVNNTRDIPVKVEIQRNINTAYWDMKNEGEAGKYEKVDADTVKYTLELDSKTKREFKYILTTHHGTRERK